ncbi:MAG: hypothetical protein Q9227_004196 [Pyrenula ochraceoflavens]
MDEVSVQIRAEELSNASLSRPRSRQFAQSQNSRDLSPDSLLGPDAHIHPLLHGRNSRSASSKMIDPSDAPDSVPSRLRSHDMELTRMSRLLEDLQSEMQHLRDTIIELKSCNKRRSYGANIEANFAESPNSAAQAVQEGTDEGIQFLRAENKALKRRLAAITNSLSLALSRQNASPSLILKQNIAQRVGSSAVNSKRKRTSVSNFTGSTMRNEARVLEPPAQSANRLKANGRSDSACYQDTDAEVPDFSDEDSPKHPLTRPSVVDPAIPSDRSGLVNGLEQHRDSFDRQSVGADVLEVDSDFRPVERKRQRRPTGRPPGRPRKHPRPEGVRKVAVRRSPRKDSRGKDDDDCPPRTRASTLTKLAPSEAVPGEDARSTISDHKSRSTSVEHEAPSGDAEITNEDLSTQLSAAANAAPRLSVEGPNNDTNKRLGTFENNSSSFTGQGTSASKSRLLHLGGSPGFPSVTLLGKEWKATESGQSLKDKLAERERLVQETMEREERESIAEE